MDDTIYARTAAMRRRIADLYDATAPDLLDGPSLCEGWSLRTLLGHVLMPLEVSMPQLLRAAVRYRSFDRASTALSTRIGARPVPELTGLLRRGADRRFDPPGVGPMGQFVDCAVHLRDAARPLGSDADVPLEDWAAVLEWLPSKQAGRGHVPRRLLDGLSWRATDVDWSHGEGPEVRGKAEALALAMTGRPVVLPELTGDGVAELARRLA